MRLLLRAWLCACVLSFCHPHSARAQTSRLGLRVSLDAAAMLSRDQVGRLGYDRIGLLGGIHAGYAVAPQVDLTFGGSGGAFLSSSERTGGLVAPTLGLVAHGARDALSPYASCEVGPGITGTLVRPFLRLALGLDIPVSRRLMLGPAAGYAQLLQTNGPGASTDARYVWVGLTFLYRHLDTPKSENPPPAARVVVVHHTQKPPPVVEAPETDLTLLIERALPASRVELLAPVLFAFDSDQLEPVGVAMLHEVARELRERPDILRVSIQGYADSRGSTEYNRSLSERRAQRVFDWLVEHGIADTRLQIDAEGASGPVEEGKTEPAHQQNRRVVFRVLETATP